MNFKKILFVNVCTKERTAHTSLKRSKLKKQFFTNNMAAKKKKAAKKKPAKKGKRK